MEIEHELVEEHIKKPDDFLKIKETLTRIGISDSSGKSLSQSCHILHKRGKYYIVHFLQMFMLDGKRSSFSNEDRGRLNYIVAMIEKWGLVEVVNPSMILTPVLVGKSNIKVIPHKEKDKWILVSKYSIGSN